MISVLRQWHQKLVLKYHLSLAYPSGGLEPPDGSFEHTWFFQEHVQEYENGLASGNKLKCQPMA